MELNSREIAILIWLAIFVGGVVATSADCRLSFVNFLRALFHPKVLLTIAIAILWILASVWLLKTIGVWKPGNFKTTLIWTLTFAIVTLFDVHRVSEDSTFFYRTARDAISGTALVAFIADLNTFPLIVWLFLTPCLFFITACHVMAKSKYSKVENKLLWLLSLIGASYIGNGAYQAISDFNNFASLSNFQEFFTPPLLSLLFLPYLYFLNVCFTYETKFVLLHLFISDQALRNYAMRKALLEFSFNLELLRRWSREIDRIRPSSRSAIEQSFHDVKVRMAREKKPPPVATSDGWSPYTAKKFLMGMGLAVGEYHPSDDDWFASSPLIELDDSILANKLAYYIEGDELSAKRLKLILNINNLDESTAAEDYFWRVASVLVRAATGDIHYDLLTRRNNTNIMDEIVNSRHISIRKQHFTGGITCGYSLKLAIGHEEKN